MSKQDSGATIKGEPVECSTRSDAPIHEGSQAATLGALPSPRQDVVT